MPLILQLETSTEVCSVALSRGDQLLSLSETDERYAHAEQITLRVQACMEEAGVGLEELSAVAISRGPGSYTGLRVGASVAKGICYALEKPLIAVSTLEALAVACRRERPGAARYCPMIDARRMEVYTALYDGDGQELLAPHAKIIDALSFATHYHENQRMICCGNGAEKCQTVLDSEFLTFCALSCSAAHMIPLSYRAFQAGQFVDSAYFSPDYIKPPNITTPRKIL